ncbi:MAG: hypothetical protein MZV70_67335 [Desulfobacterales bacterium]|nr:hypothetical protein [Desulfobacterales bacterium]
MVKPLNREPGTSLLESPRVLHPKWRVNRKIGACQHDATIRIQTHPLRRGRCRSGGLHRRGLSCQGRLRGHPMRRGAGPAGTRARPGHPTGRCREPSSQKVTRTCLAIDDLAAHDPEVIFITVKANALPLIASAIEGFYQEGDVRHQLAERHRHGAGAHQGPGARRRHAGRGQLRLRLGGAGPCAAAVPSPPHFIQELDPKSKAATLAIAAGAVRLRPDHRGHAGHHLHGLAQRGPECLHESRLRRDRPHHEPRHDRSDRLPDRQRPGEGMHPGRARERDQPGLGLLPQRHRVHEQGRRPQALHADGHRGRPPHRGGLHQRQVRRVRPARRGGHPVQPDPAVAGEGPGVEHRVQEESDRAIAAEKIAMANAAPLYVGADVGASRTKVAVLDAAKTPGRLRRAEIGHRFHGHGPTSA